MEKKPDTKRLHMAIGKELAGGWTEMTGITFCVNIGSVSGPFRLTKWPNLGNS